MVVKHKGAAHLTVVACPLLPYNPEFELGRTLAEARNTVQPKRARLYVVGEVTCARH
jgi:hypothetical protein